MLYTRAELHNHENENLALKRYLHKFTNHRKEVKRFKLHEKEFMFRSMNAIIQVSEGVEEIDQDCETDIEAYQYLEKNGLAKRAYNLYEIEEAYEYVFYKIVLTYYHNLNFLMPAHGHLGLLSKAEINIDKSFFEYYLPIWQKLLFSGKGGYMTHLLPEYNRKHKILEDVRKNGIIGYNAFKSKDLEAILACYHIYYKVKLFFDGYGKLYHKFEIEGIPFVFDVYSYVHILSRHYMPDTNRFDVEKSFNDELPFIDIDSLPFSFESLCTLPLASYIQN